jgi:polar amino acid transport system substrate-binding protein
MRRCVHAFMRYDGAEHERETMQLTSKQRRLVLGASGLLACWPAVGAGPGHGAVPATLRIVTSHLPPLAIDNGGQTPGALHEVVTELCKRLQMAPALAFMPWKRAIFLATAGPATTIFPLTRSPERERQFRWLAPLYDEQYVFLAPRGRAFDVHHPANMQAMRIAHIRGSAVKAVLQAMGYHNFVEAGSVDEVHRFLAAGIADAAYGELSIVRQSLRARGTEADFVHSAALTRTAAWLAGSLDFTEADAARFQRAMHEMKADGSYFAILKRYQLG